MASYTYAGLAFRQQSSAPVQVAFVAHAAEIIEWAGVPRKQDEFLTGYQRFRDDNRINSEIVPFFQTTMNCSPTAIVIALRLNSGGGKCAIEPADVPVGTIVQVMLKIEVDTAAIASDRVFEIAQSILNPRIQRDTDSRAAAETEEDAAEDEHDDDGGTDADDDEGGDTSVHLGTVTLQRIGEYLANRENWKNQKFRDSIADLVKPGLIIDGQHRATAAAKIGPKGLPFLVCGLLGASWEEQVFQFTVINIRPRKIPTALVTSIAGLSLTKTEQEAVKVRLAQAGVKMDEVTIMSLVAYDERSPFVDMVDMAMGAVSERSNLLGYGGIKRIAREWYGCNRASLINIAKQLFSTSSVGAAKQRWRREGAWFEFFCRFWNQVREVYGDDIWEKKDGNKLLVTANLWALQEALLLEADGQRPRVWQVSEKVAEYENRLAALDEAMKDLVTATLDYIPKDAWLIAWKNQSQDTTAGRAAVLTFLKEELIDHGKKNENVRRNWKNLDWFKAKKSRAKQDVSGEEDEVDGAVAEEAGEE